MFTLQQALLPVQEIKSFLLLASFSKTLPPDDQVSRQRLRVFRITTTYALLTFAVAIGQLFWAQVPNPLLAMLMSLLFLGTFINYFALSVHKKANAAYIILAFLAYAVLHVVSYGTGGVRNSGMLYLASIILIAYMLLGKKGGLVMAGACVVHMIYFYILSTYTNWTDYSLIGKGNGAIEFDFLITGLLSILCITAQSNAIEKTNNTIINDIKSKKDELAQKNEALLAAQKDLESKNRELLQKNRDLEQFAYISSHDLQEPLRTMSDFAGLLQRRYQGKLDDKADKYLDFITQSAERMKTLIKDLLQYSQIGSETKHEPIDFAAVLQDVMVDIGKMIKETHADIVIAPMPVLHGNATAIKQLFQNLLLNAIKFSKKDTVPNVKIAAVLKQGFWEFSVADNGIGIAQQHLHRIFDIFQRLHTRSEYSGSGIGLSHCKKIVEMHGGKIWVESFPGQGSTFFFTMPTAKQF